ncbi:MAG TPA: outer membrane lipoprotein-sorting protein [Polyangiaceae bacterium]|nr:outer membrane lipoprotein-sorting protein [Polyangiaceae bacterium]
MQRIWVSRVLLASGALLLWPAARASASAPSPTELIAKADHALRGQTTAALLEMHIHTQSYDRNYSMLLWGDERGGTSRALIKILGPARWRGHGTLKIGGRLSLYDPSTDRITVLSGSMLADNWMGSHFSNDDLVKETELARDYTARVLKDWTAEVAGKPAVFHRILLSPTPRAPVAWDHIVFELYEQGGSVIPSREEYYQRQQQPAPTRMLTFDSVKTMGDRVVPTRLTVHVADKPSEFTELVYKQLRFDADVPESKFSEQELRR